MYLYVDLEDDILLKSRFICHMCTAYQVNMSLLLIVLLLTLTASTQMIKNWTYSDCLIDIVSFTCIL